MKRLRRGGSHSVSDIPPPLPAKDQKSTRKQRSRTFGAFPDPEAQPTLPVLPPLERVLPFGYSSPNFDEGICLASPTGYFDRHDSKHASDELDAAMGDLVASMATDEYDATLAAHARGRLNSTSRTSSSTSGNSLSQSASQISVGRPAPSNSSGHVFSLFPSQESNPRVNIETTIALLQELRKNASPQELVALHRALLPTSSLSPARLPISRTSPLSAPPSAGLPPTPGRSSPSKQPSMSGMRRRTSETPGIATRIPSVVSPTAPPPQDLGESTWRTSADAPLPLNVSSGLRCLDPREGAGTPGAPGDISHLGALQLGSLIITNGTASPAPSSRHSRQKKSEDLNEEGYFTASEGRLSQDSKSRADLSSGSDQFLSSNKPHAAPGHLNLHHRSVSRDASEIAQKYLAEIPHSPFSADRHSQTSVYSQATHAAEDVNLPKPLRSVTSKPSRFSLRGLRRGQASLSNIRHGFSSESTDLSATSVESYDLPPPRVTPAAVCFNVTEPLKQEVEFEFPASQSIGSKKLQKRKVSSLFIPGSGLFQSSKSSLNENPENESTKTKSPVEPSPLSPHLHNKHHRRTFSERRELTHSSSRLFSGILSFRKRTNKEDAENELSITHESHELDINHSDMPLPVPNIQERKQSPSVRRSHSLAQLESTQQQQRPQMVERESFAGHAEALLRQRFDHHETTSSAYHPGSQQHHRPRYSEDIIRVNKSSGHRHAASNPFPQPPPGLVGKLQMQQQLQSRNSYQYTRSNSTIGHYQASGSWQTYPATTEPAVTKGRMSFDSTPREYQPFRATPQYEAASPERFPSSYDWSRRSVSSPRLKDQDVRATHGNASYGRKHSRHQDVLEATTLARA